MGNGTKVGLILVLVLGVVVIATLLDRDLDQTPTGPEQIGNRSGVKPSLDNSTDPGSGSANEMASANVGNGNVGNAGEGGDRFAVGTLDNTSGNRTPANDRSPGGNRSDIDGAGVDHSDVGNSYVENSVNGSGYSPRPLAADPQNLYDGEEASHGRVPLDAVLDHPLRPVDHRAEVGADLGDAAQAVPAVFEELTGPHGDLSSHVRGEIGALPENAISKKAMDSAESGGVSHGGVSHGGDSMAGSGKPAPDSTAGVDPLDTHVNSEKALSSNAVRGFPKKHKVTTGDRLWTLAEDYYQSGVLFHLIVKANPGINPDVLKVGSELVIPAPPANTRIAKGAVTQEGTTQKTPRPRVVGRTYTIRAGDTYYHIAADHLGDSQRWKDIEALNPGIDPGALKVGTVIKLPAK